MSAHLGLSRFEDALALLDAKDAEIARLKAILRVAHLDWSIHQTLAPSTVERIAAAVRPTP